MAGALAAQERAAQGALPPKNRMLRRGLVLKVSSQSSATFRGGGRPLLREGAPISYQPRPEATFPPAGALAAQEREAQGAQRRLACRFLSGMEHAPTTLQKCAAVPRRARI